MLVIVLVQHAPCWANVTSSWSVMILTYTLHSPITINRWLEKPTTGNYIVLYICVFVSKCI